MKDLQERLEASHNHYSSPTFILGDWQLLGPEWPILNEYLLSCIVTLVFAMLLYYTLSSLSYLIFFRWGKETFTPRREELKIQKQQFMHDIKWSALNIVGQVPLVALIKLGYPYFSKIQYSIELKPILIGYLFLHYLYDQFFTYWIHRILHHPKIYKKLHYIHHESKKVTPFTGFAFHPLDAFLQALPALTSCYFIPLPIDFVLAHSLITSLWAISIHDNVNIVPFKGILYAGSHSIHHFPWGTNYNYGKFTSICDRLYGSYCDPQAITGYGYKFENATQNLLNKVNNLYNTLVPDLGASLVEKVRKTYAKKLD